MSEAFANYGFLGVAFLAVLLAVFYGWVGRQSIGVPLLSLRFLFAVLVLSGTLSSNNTMGVFVTTLWQSAMALLTLGLLLTKKMPNPLYVQAKVAPAKNMELAESGRQEGAGEKFEAGGSGHPSSICESPSPDSVRHERPTRFVYGERIKK